MIINLSTWQSRVAATTASTLRSPVVVIADKQRSARTLDLKWQEAAGEEREALVDLRWYRPPDMTPDWFEGPGFAGRTRSEIQRSEANRREFFDMLAQRYPTGPLVAPSGRVDDVAGCMDLAREMVQLREEDYSNRQVLASVALRKSSLQDAAVLNRLTLPDGVDGVVLTVLDAAAYPSVWTEQDWFSWLRLVGTLSQAGHRLILGSCDLRGLVALGVATKSLDFSSGVTTEDRQAPLDPRTPGGGGARSPVAYLSAPLLAIMHGDRLAVDTDASGVAATYNRCQPYGSLPVSNRSRSIDDEWKGEHDAVGVRIQTRITRHLRDLAAIEAWIRGQQDSRRAVERMLSHAAATATDVPSYVFKTPGTRDELTNRLRAYQRACRTLGLTN